MGTPSAPPPPHAPAPQTPARPTPADRASETGTSTASTFLKPAGGSQNGSGRAKPKDRKPSFPNLAKALKAAAAAARAAPGSASSSSSASTSSSSSAARPRLSPTPVQDSLLGFRPKTPTPFVTDEGFFRLVARMTVPPDAPVLHLPGSEAERDAMNEYLRRPDAATVRLIVPYTKDEWTSGKAKDAVVDPSDYLEISGSFRLETQDGYVIGQLVANAIGTVLGDDKEGLKLAEQLGQWVEDEVWALPAGAPHPASNDKRHEGFIDERDHRRGAHHFVHGVGQGHNNAAEYQAWSDLRNRGDFAKKLVLRLDSMLELVNKATYIFDESMWREMRHQWKTKLADGPHARALPSEWLMHQGLIAVHNTGADDHVDPSDARKLRTAMFVLGQFLGGQLRLKQAGVYSEYRPADLLFLDTATTYHRVGHVNEDGIRHSMLLLWHQKLWELGCTTHDWTSLKANMAPRFGHTHWDDAHRREADAEGTRRARELDEQDERAAGKRARSTGPL
ncbi:hypothetical protein JCM9279_002274 [Rhodotorula babjevae]